MNLRERSEHHKFVDVREREGVTVAFVPVLNSAEVRLEYTSTAFHGGNPTIRFYVRNTTIDEWPFADLMDLCEGYKTLFWTGEQQSLVSDNLRLDKITATDASREFGVQASLVVDELGIIATPVLPANVAALVRWRAAEPGPPRIGYTYLPGLVESQVDFNSLSASGLIAMTSTAQVLKDTAGDVAVGHAFVIASKYSGMALGPVQPNGTRKMVPVPRETAETNTVQDPDVRVAISHQDRRVKPD